MTVSFKGKKPSIYHKYKKNVKSYLRTVYCWTPEQVNNFFEDNSVYVRALYDQKLPAYETAYQVHKEFGSK